MWPSDGQKMTKQNAAPFSSPPPLSPELSPMTTDRPQAPGYLANLMARLFHEISAQGLQPLGIEPDHFPVLIELWFGPGASRASLCDSQEADAGVIDPLVRGLASAGFIDSFPVDPAEKLTLTDKGRSVRDAAIAAARRANQAATDALSEDEMAQFTSMMNRVIDALKAARA
jgi:DNA-binding MarR family transcriptional regulator